MGRRIIINGQEVDEEQLIKMQEEAQKQYWERWEQLRKTFDCNCALVQDMGGGQFYIVCSLTKDQLRDPNFCSQECKAYNNTDYSKVGYET